MLSSHRGVIDIIFGEVFVVLARFRATDVVTLRCSKLSDIRITPFEIREPLKSRNRPLPCSGALSAPRAWKSHWFNGDSRVSFRLHSVRHVRQCDIGQRMITPPRVYRPKPSAE